MGIIIVVYNNKAIKIIMINNNKTRIMNLKMISWKMRKIRIKIIMISHYNNNKVIITMEMEIMMKNMKKI